MITLRVGSSYFLSRTSVGQFLGLLASPGGDVACFRVEGEPYLQTEALADFVAPFPLQDNDRSREAVRRHLQLANLRMERVADAVERACLAGEKTITEPMSEQDSETLWELGYQVHSVARLEKPQRIGPNCWTDRALVVRWA